MLVLQPFVYISHLNNPRLHIILYTLADTGQDAYKNHQPHASNAGETYTLLIVLLLYATYIYVLYRSGKFCCYVSFV